MKINIDLMVLSLVEEYNHVTLGMYLGNKLWDVVAMKNVEEEIK